MAVYLTGDTHGEFTRFNSKRFKEQKELTRNDIVIILGDFGIWHDTNEERWWFDWLAEKDFTLCFVDGNHENYDRLYSDEFPIVDFHGGKAQKIRDNIFHLMRGYVFEFEGKKFFCMGGASSHDISDGILNVSDFDDEDEFYKTARKWDKQGKEFRINHLSWWKNEIPSREEMDLGEVILTKNNYEVDYVITHCLPQSVASVAGWRTPDALTNYFDKLLDNGLKFKRWYCGHYHCEKSVFGKFVIKYFDIERVL